MGSGLYKSSWTSLPTPFISAQWLSQTQICRKCLQIKLNRFMPVSTLVDITSNTFYKFTVAFRTHCTRDNQNFSISCRKIQVIGRPHKTWFFKGLCGEYLSWYTQYNDQATGWMIQGLVPGKINRSYSLQTSNPAVAPTQPFKWGMWLLSLEVKQVGRKADL
jgi:hypothetical protein